MKKIYLYTIKDEYIDYLKIFENKVLDNKKGKRKYIGILLYINNIKYLAPLSSPKKKDYKKNGKIRKDPIFLTRIITENKEGRKELKGKILFSNMIPVCNDVFKKYNPNQELNKKYQDLVIKELDFITKHRKQIYRKANIVYKQKTGIYQTSNKNNSYLECTINFRYLEIKSKKYHNINKNKLN